MPKTGRDLSELDLECIWHPLTQHSQLAASPPLVIDSASGSFLYDRRGQRWLDAVSGLWCVNVGHGRAELAEAAREQMEKLAYVPATMSHEPGVFLARKVLDLLGFEGKVYYTVTGSEANEAAFKIARQYHRQTPGGAGRYKIIGRDRSYHGNTLGALSASGQEERRLGYEPLAPGFLHVESPDSYRGSADCAAALEAAILAEGAESVAAFVMEPVIAGGGVLLPPEDYLPRVREICDRHGVLLILDEVVTGFGRTGRWFGHHHWGVEPDIVTLAKGIASGYMPVAATVVRQRIFEAFSAEPGGLEHFRHVNTYGGHPVATAVALRNLEIVEREGLVERAAETGRRLLDSLQRRLDHPQVGDVRGLGLLIGIELVQDRGTREPLSGDDTARVVKRCAQEGVIVGRTINTAPGFSNVLIVAPPFTLSEEEAELLVGTLEAALTKELSAGLRG